MKTNTTTKLTRTQKDEMHLNLAGWKKIGKGQYAHPDGKKAPDGGFWSRTVAVKCARVSNSGTL